MSRWRGVPQHRCFGYNFDYVVTFVVLREPPLVFFLCPLSLARSTLMLVQGELALRSLLCLLSGTPAPAYMDGIDLEAFVQVSHHRRAEWRTDKLPERLPLPNLHLLWPHFSVSSMMSQWAVTETRHADLILLSGERGSGLSRSNSSLVAKSPARPVSAPAPASAATSAQGSSANAKSVSASAVETDDDASSSTHSDAQILCPSPPPAVGRLLLLIGLLAFHSGGRSLLEGQVGHVAGITEATWLRQAQLRRWRLTCVCLSLVQVGMVS
jgi:hypothetical protein